MMRIHKIGTAGLADYLANTVAKGYDEYLAGRGESPGRWLGGGALSLGLSGQVEREQFRSLLDGFDPQTGADLCSHRRADRNRGYDLTFGLPKSLSVMYGLGEPWLARRIRQAHLDGIGEAIHYLETFACSTRRGTNGAERIETTGLVCAAYTHRLSRAGDPHLHDHVIVPNVVLGTDGRWSALDGEQLYAHTRAASGLYRAKVRHSLADLGLTWNFAQDGLAEACAVPQPVLREFSRRRRDIEREYAKREGELAARGLTGANAAQYLARETRPPKVRGVDNLWVAATWHARADEHNFRRDQITDAIEQGREKPPPTVFWEEVVDRLLGPTGLTRETAVFTTLDLLARLSDSLPAGVGSVDELLERAERVLADPRVVRLTGAEQHFRGAATQEREAQYTTTEFLHLEQCLIDSAQSRRQQGAGVVDEGLLNHELTKRPGLGEDQAEMVKRLCRDGDGLSVVHALAGAGKTRGLEAACAAWKAQGYVVMGTAVAKRAANVLADKAGIPTVTLAQLLVDIQAPDGAPASHSVIVVDEAGMVGTRQLAILEAACARTGAKLVLTGDSKQLPEIEAGGGYAALVKRLPTISLSRNRRQADELEQLRLRELRTGNVGLAMRSYEEDGLVVKSATYDDALQSTANAWLTDHLAGRDAAMLALSRETVRDLNEAAREVLAAAGKLTGEPLCVHDRLFQAGDLVITRRNDKRLGVANGDRWTVAAIDHDGQSVHLVGERGQAVLPERYWSRRTLRGEESLQHAYAITTHVGQGSDVQCPHIFASPSAYRELGYTAASRATTLPVWYVVDNSPTEIEHCHPHGHIETDQDSLQKLISALNRSRAKTAAVDSGTPVGKPIVHPIRERPVRLLSDDQLTAEWEMLARGLAQTEPPLVSGVLEQTRAAGQEARRQHHEALADVEVAQEHVEAVPRWRRRQLRDARLTVQTREAAAVRYSQEVDRLDGDVASLEEAAQTREAWEQKHEPDCRRLGVLSQELSRRETPSRDDTLAPQLGLGVGS